MSNSTTPTAGAIFPEAMYRLPATRELMGWGSAGLRSARRKGLRVFYVGRSAFIRGADLIAHVEQHATAEKPGAMNPKEGEAVA